MTKVFLDSGAAVTSIAVGLFARVSSHFGGANLQVPFEHGAQTAHTATGTPGTVSHKTVLLQVNLRTPYGVVKMPTLTFAVVPGSDNVIMFGLATMRTLGLDVYLMAMERLRSLAVAADTEAAS